MTPFLIFVALMLLTFCKNRGLAQNTTYLGFKLKKTFGDKVLCFYIKFSLTKKMCKKLVLSRFYKFFGDGSNFCEKFSFPKLILD